MTDLTLELTEAFNRHNSLYNALLGNLKTLTTEHTEEVSITLDAGKVRALTRILNAAQLDGSPLYTRVNVATDTDVWETDASKVNRYLEENDWEPTLNNVAAAFIYAETNFPHLDIELKDKSYRVARIDHIEQYTGDGRARGGGYTKITVDAPGTLNVTTKTNTIPRKDDKPEIITYVPSLQTRAQQAHTTWQKY